MLKMTLKEFVARARSVHGRKYDYSESIYEGTDKKLVIICKEHGKFLLSPYKHTKRKQRCKKCGIRKRAAASRGTKESFVAKANSVHGMFYDYSKVKYETTAIKVTIICPKHGPFKQTPNSHLRPTGCPDCGRESLAEWHRSDTEAFIKKAVKVHGKVYDYREVAYVDNVTNIKIKCNLHGIFAQSPASHLMGRGCHECGKQRVAAARTSNTKAFIAAARKKHKTKYDYSNVIYEKNNRKVTIICAKHGAFEQTPQSHLMGNGCYECGLTKQVKARTTTRKTFIAQAKKVHGDNYDYERVVYKSTHSKVDILCSTHGLFPQTPASHLSGAGCADCAGVKLLTTEEFIARSREVHGNLYGYKTVEYINESKNVQINCSIHGTFPQRPHIHMRGAGCPRCFNKGEGKLAVSLNKRAVVHRQFKISNRYYDFLLPEYDLILERDGEQHYPAVWSRKSSNIFNKRGTLKDQKNNDSYKVKLAKKHGYRIARIPYWLNRREIEIELDNILAGKPTYPELPNPKQEKTQPKPVKNP